jgi:tetratricopeptide (TPR) repeat protein
MGQSIWALPASEDSVAAQYESDARTSMMRNDIDSAIGSLRSAVNKDPKFARAWLLLGSMLGARLQSDESIESFHNAVSADPTRAISYKLLGFGLMSARQYENAVGTWQSLIKLAPNDEDAQANLGLAFLSLKRYGDAASALESAIKILPDKVTLHLSLASSYLNAGDTIKAHGAFERAIKLDSSPMVLNEVAYELAEKNFDLDSARDYSEKAVRTEEEAAGSTTLANIKGSDINHAQTLSAYWDTLGWVYFRLNDLPRAERYVKAAWRVSQSPVIGEHLGRIYEKQGKRLAAVHIYQLAHSAGPLRVAIRPVSPISDTGNDVDNDLKRLGGKPDTGKTVTELSLMRTFRLPRIVKGSLGRLLCSARARQ